jgi:hypothetical protein
MSEPAATEAPVSATPAQTEAPASSQSTQTAAATPAQPNDSSFDWIGSIDEAITAGVKSEADPKEEDPKAAKEEPVKEDGDKAAEEDVEELPTMSKAAGAKFKQLKAEVKTWKQKVADLEKQVAEKETAEQQFKVPEDYETLKNQVAEYEKEISVSRVEASPQFKQSVIEPLNGVLSAAYAMASRYQVPEQTMEAVLQEQNPAKQDELLQEMVSGFTERDRLNLYRLVDDIGVILQRREEILTNASQARELLTKQEQERVSSETKQAMQNVWEVLSKKVPLFSDTKIAEEVRSKALSSNLLEAKPDVRAYAAYSGAVLPHLLKQNQSLTTKVAELEKTLAGIRKTVPKAGQGKTVAAEVASDIGFLDALEAQL